MEASQGDLPKGKGFQAGTSNGLKEAHDKELAIRKSSK